MNIFAVEIYFVILSTLNTKLTTNPTCAILNINEQKKNYETVIETNVIDVFVCTLCMI